MKYIIFGSGGFAKELIDYVESDGHDILGIVSTVPFNSELYSRKYDVVENVSLVKYQHEASFLLGVGDIHSKKAIVQKNENRWETFIHSSSHVSKNSKIGKGTIICPFATVLGDCEIGNFVTLNVYSCVAHDNTVGNYVTYSPWSGTMGNCKVGDECFFGTSAYCIPGVDLAKGCKVSAGSMVRKSHSVCNDILIGNPATPYKKLA